jgi:hypothetical protein
MYEIFLISNFCHVLNVVCFLLGDSPAPEFYMPTFRNRQCVPKCWHIKFRRWGITQKKAYNMYEILHLWSLCHSLNNGMSFRMGAGGLGGLGWGGAVVYCDSSKYPTEILVPKNLQATLSEV